MDKLTLLQKIQAAKTFIKECKPKKDGTNDFSKYDYFTPEIVDKLVNDACEKYQMTTIFLLKRDEFGVYGELQICDLESSAFSTYYMATEKPVIKATNETQQMGGCQTYTKRYMKMNAFDIEDNSSDFDSQDNRPKAKKPALTEVLFNKAINRIKGGEKGVLPKLKNAFEINPDYLTLLTDAENEIK